MVKMGDALGNRFDDVGAIHYLGESPLNPVNGGSS
jgi:hypothetical protein